MELIQQKKIKTTVTLSIQSRINLGEGGREIRKKEIKM